jgi:hypothetical protein
VATLYTLHDLTKRLSEKTSLREYHYPMPGQDLKPYWAGRKFLSLQPRGYLRRSCIVMEKFLKGNP